MKKKYEFKFNFLPKINKVNHIEFDLLNFLLIFTITFSLLYFLTDLITFNDVIIASIVSFICNNGIIQYKIFHVTTETTIENIGEEKKNEI